MNDWNFLVREVGRGRGVQERSLEIGTGRLHVGLCPAHLVLFVDQSSPYFSPNVGRVVVDQGFLRFPICRFVT